MVSLDCYKEIIGSVFRRYFEGNKPNIIDKINYYKARENYYQIKASETKDIDDFQRFDRKRAISRRAWKHLEFKVAA